MPIRVDPVCGRPVDESAAAVQAHFSQHLGRTYYFCSMACKQQFDRNQQAYVMTTDIVCNKEIDIDAAEAKGLYAEHESTRYYFCSQQCRAKFEVAPEFYTQHHQEDQHTHPPEATPPE